MKRFEPAPIVMVALFGWTAATAIPLAGQAGTTLPEPFRW